MPAAIQLRRRLGVQVFEDEFVKIERGVVKMRGYVDDDLQVCEFWTIDDA